MKSITAFSRMNWLQRMAAGVRIVKHRIIVFMTIMLVSLSVSAHVFEIRYNQAPDGSITWYLISYHITSQCPNESAGLTVNGVNYPITFSTLGDARPLSPNILVQDLGCYQRLNPTLPPLTEDALYASYGIVNTPFIPGLLSIAPYSNLVCFAFCVGGTIVFNPPPVVNCPPDVPQIPAECIFNAYINVPGPTVIDNCTYSGTNPEMVSNGDFSAQDAGWNDCGNLVEAYCTETCYGGPDATNRTAEIDHEPVTLCQDISGFVIGKMYQLKFKATRRTQAPTPATVGAIVSIDGGALNTTVTRSNTTWGFTDETFTFIATQATHRLTMVPTAGWSGTYGLIVDDISVKKMLGSITNDYNNTSDASDFYPIGSTTVVWTIVHCDGSTSTCTQVVTRSQEINISLCASKTDIIYTGTAGGFGPYGPTSVTISSTVSGGTPGYTYSWSPGGQTTPDITVSPAVTTTYTLTVTDSKGCYRSLSKTIQVLPLSSAVCNTNGNIKFAVCHIPPGNPSNPQNICISPNALNAHLTSGTNGHNNCYLGPCRDLCVSTAPAQAQRGLAPEYVTTAPEEGVTELTIMANPNPSTSSFELQMESADKNTTATVRVVDDMGKPTQVFSKIPIGSVLRFGSSYSRGIYFIEVIQGTERRMIKLIKL